MDLQREADVAIESKTPSRTNRDGRTKQLAEQNDPPALSLDERGMIQDCSKSFENLFGFPRRDLVWHHISSLFPQLAGVELVQAGQVNPLLKYLCRCGQLYQAQNRQGDTLSSNLSFVRIEFGGRRFLRLIVHP